MILPMFVAFYQHRVATVQSIDRYFIERGYQHVQSILGQEFGHHWIAANIPVVKLTEGEASASGVGYLTDDNTNFVEEGIFPGDQLMIRGSAYSVSEIQPNS